MIRHQSSIDIFNNNASQTIHWMRATLCVFILLLHTFPPLYGHAKDIYFYIHRLVDVAVPLFFAVSGFLLFWKEDFAFETYLLKLKKRIKSLVVPFFLWNIFCLVFLILKAYLFLYIANDPESLNAWEAKGPIGWAQAIIGLPIPSNSVLWFVRDLAICIIISPLIYWLTKRFSVIYILALSLFWFVNPVGCLLDLWGGGEPIFWFSLGVWCALNKKALLAIRFDKKTSLRVFLSLYLLFPLILLFFGDNENQLLKNLLQCLTILIGAAAVISGACIANKRWHLPNVVTWLSNASFFIYCSHIVFSRVFIAGILRIVSKHLPETTSVSLIIYLIYFVILCAMSFGFYAFTKRFFPKVCAILNGGR